MGGKVLELETDKFIKKIRDKYKDELEAAVKALNDAIMPKLR